MTVRFVVRRLAQSGAVIVMLTLGTSVLFRLLPGGPGRALLGPRASQFAVDNFDRTHGFDRSFLTQYLDYLDRLLIHGDLGYSFADNQSVAAILGHELPKSLILVGSSTLIAVVLGATTGLFQAARRDGLADHVLTAASFTVYAIPSFVIALLLVDVFAIRLHVLPTEGPQGNTWTDAFAHPSAMVLPVVTLVLASLPVLTRYARASAVDVMSRDYIRAARGKGLSEFRLLRTHVLSNAAGPLITLLGLSLPGLVSGAIVVETVFNYPGIGLESVRAATNHDYAVLLGLTIVIGVATTLGSLLADLAYGAIDPRVRAT